jgi:glyoxylase-like metal-dependent hydrolase (beta-lactamase superfamily II)
MRITEVAPGFQVISGFTNGNLLAFTGQRSVLLVDGQSAKRVALADSALRTVTPLPVTLVVSTHYHDDHIGGNPHWRARGARILAHAAVAAEARKDTTIPEMSWHRTAADPDALADQTFTDSLVLDFEGEPVVLLHPVGAHTNGDAMVWFPRANILHTGDIVEREAPPFIDWWAGGALDGMIAAVDGILARVNDRTIIVPGHGTPADRAGVVAYRAMLAATRDRIGAQLRQGLAADAIVAGRPLREFEEMLGGERRAGQFARQVVMGLGSARPRP